MSLTAAGCAHAPPPPDPLGELPADTADTPAETASRELRIHLERQTFAYLEDGEVVRTGPVSSGTARSPTPKGRFSILSKEEDKVSSRYDNALGTPAWMPYSMQFHGHYFVHEGWLPGHADSHGCVRLGYQDAKFLFERMKIGDRVEVID
jgi:lipoprotein-anchoring transpeptidase ErfK/SrfK